MTITAARVPQARRPREASTDHERGWELVAAHQAGDPTAAGDLYRMYQPELLRYLRARIHADPGLVEDLAADVWIRALRGLHRVERSATTPLAWLVTVARNLLTDHWKRARVQREWLFDDITAAAGDRSSSDDTEATILSYLSDRALYTAMNRLPERHREVLVLRFMRQMSVDETAAALGLNEGAVKALQFRATRALTRLLTERPEGS